MNIVRTLSSQLRICDPQTKGDDLKRLLDSFNVEELKNFLIENKGVNKEIMILALKEKLVNREESLKNIVNRLLEDNNG